ncbi:hypothetical protein CVT26_015764 [Gymnopilus dilepis]|uniref:Uncharacterized protein n=1 Tax=Gymnopilus dilepis TaxID=231916 RepID=A0A409VFP3_9AGAR|nr:hypothetical protein CVT26_015764 [Gymnopilus dilepis]
MYEATKCYPFQYLRREEGDAERLRLEPPARASGERSLRLDDVGGVRERLRPRSTGLRERDERYLGILARVEPDPKLTLGDLERRWP